MLITGATGFVGEALLQRLLADVPDARPLVLVRPRRGQSGAQRIQTLMGKPAFASLREQVGGQAALAARVDTIEGDLGDVPALPSDLDVVVHCAGDVSFDPAVDEGFEVNLRGTRRLLDAIDAAGGRPHYVHVSTAYVAGLRRGRVLEGPLGHDVDWREEDGAAMRMRGEVEVASRLPDQLRRFHREAQKEHRRAGPTTVSRDAERRRRAWVEQQLVDAGRERARSLGWTDCYTFTKAMAERMVEQTATGLPVSIVRPSIIESALRTPFPGWIEGFKMAEPLILAYGRGELPEFPAIPDGVIDIIPVDLVVNALLAVAASTPEPGGPAYFHVSSGARNPLRFHALYSHVRDYFDAHPLQKRDRGAIAVPTWRFPGADRVETTLHRWERVHSVTERVIEHLPPSARSRETLRTLDRQQARLDFLRRYNDLYRPYAEAEVLFDDRNTVRLLAELPASERELFDFDAAVVDWRHYIEEVHCPSVTAVLRARRTGRAGSLAPVQLPQREDVLAVFDLEGTLMQSNVVEGYLWLRLADVGQREAAQVLAGVAAQVPRYLLEERRDRGTMLRTVYRRYAGADPDALDALVDERLASVLLSRVYPAAVRQVRQHRAAGHRTVLVTGAVRPLTRPFRSLFDEVVCAELAVDGEGRCTGFLTEPPLVGEARGAWLQHVATLHGVDLMHSYAYADSITDLSMLAAVGHPVAVNPDHALTRTARRQRWPVTHWSLAGAPTKAEATR